METVAELIDNHVARDVDLLRRLSPEERLAFFEALEHTYCPTCGRERPDRGNGRRGLCDHDAR